MTAGAAYFGSRILRHVARDMEDLAARGFTGVLHTFSENDLNFYPEAMGRIVDASHDVGLRVQTNPWGVGLTFGGEAESLWTAVHPEACQVLDDGRRVGAACPNQPGYQAFMRQWTDRAIATGADQLFWDEPHWAWPEKFEAPGERWACRCELCQRLFRERFGDDMPAELVPEVVTFRNDCLVSFLEGLVGYAAGQGASNTICLLPTFGYGIGSAESVGVSDWGPVAALDGLDTIATDPYWQHFGLDAADFVSAASRHTVELAAAHDLRPQIWIQGFRLGPEDIGDIHVAASAAREAGVDDLWVWGYEACAHMDHLRPRDPEAVWQALVDALIGRGT